MFEKPIAMLVPERFHQAHREGLHRLARSYGIQLNYTDLAGRRVRFLAKAELFEHRIMAAGLRRMGQIPVERGAADATALDDAAAALRNGQCVHVFPEGTISDDLDPMAGKTGLARLAKAAGVDVMTVGLWGTQRIIPPKGRKPERFRTPITALRRVRGIWYATAKKSKNSHTFMPSYTPKLSGM